MSAAGEESRKSSLCKQDTDKVLLVEGDTDCHVVMALCEAHNVPETFGIYECNGFEGVIRRLNGLISQSTPPQVIGIIVDADKSLSKRWQDINSKLKHYSYELPLIPNADGTIITSNTEEPKLGFWLMPNNQVSGMLEDFCADLADPESLKFARECVAQAKLKQLTTFKDVDRSKAEIHTYLAWHDEPENPLGRAITKQALRPNTDLAIKFTDWLTRLFA